MAGASTRRLGALANHVAAARDDGRGDGRQDRAAERLKGTEGGLREYIPMDRGTGVAVITGVGPGTGLAIAEKFAAEGYKVAMLARTVERLAEIEADLTERGLTATGYACDVSDPAQIQSVVEQIRADYGKPSVLIHNAVQAGGAGLDVLSWDEADLIGNFEVNMLGYIRLLKLLAPDMVEAGGGNIMCTGNTSAHRGKANFGSFASTKSGQFVLSESAARHLMPQGVHISYLTIDAAIAGAPLHSFFPSFFFQPRCLIIMSCLLIGGTHHDCTRPAITGTPPASAAVKRGAKADLFIQPSAIAAEAFHITQQDRSAWTFDHWIRPFGETW